MNIENDNIINTIDFINKSQNKITSILVKLNSVGKIDTSSFKVDLENIFEDYDSFILEYKTKNLKISKSLKDEKEKFETILVNFSEVKNFYEKLHQIQKEDARLMEESLKESLEGFKNNVDIQKQNISSEDEEYLNLIDSILNKEHALVEQLIKYHQNVIKVDLNKAVLEEGAKKINEKKVTDKAYATQYRASSAKKKKLIKHCLIGFFGFILAYKLIQPFEYAVDNLVWSSTPQEIDLYGISNLIAGVPGITNGKYVGPKVSEMEQNRKRTAEATIGVVLMHGEEKKIMATCEVDNTICENGTHFTIAANIAKKNGSMDALEALMDARIRQSVEFFNMSPHYKIKQNQTTGEYYLLKTTDKVKRAY